MMMLEEKNEILKLFPELRLKVCGMKDIRNILQVSSLKIDYIGFIFYEKSKRFVGDDFELPTFRNDLKKVGVFVDAPYLYIEKIVKQFCLDVVQLHGSETPLLCAQVREGLGIEVIKAFSVGESFDFQRLKPYETNCDFYLFDTLGKEKGGNGFSFDWQVLRHYKGKTPFFLSGGVGLDNLLNIRQLAGLPLFALDVNSRFETSPAQKDVEALRLFTSHCKA